MNLWEYIESELLYLRDKTKYIKWLEYDSSHFFSFEIPESICDKKTQKKIFRKYWSNYNDSGNHLTYLSSRHYIIKNDELVPLYLVPLEPKFNYKTKLLTWNITSDFFEPNIDFKNVLTSINVKEIDDEIRQEKLNEIENYTKDNFAIYFNQYSNNHIINDLSEIASAKLSSSSTDRLFSEDVSFRQPHTEYGFLDTLHLLETDSSQSVAINKAKEKSISISGPPGTGKSQTILNIALEEIGAGKKVAILSQKKAAVDVIYSRLKEINLEYIAWHHSSFKEWVSNLEHTIKKIIDFDQPTTHEFEISFKHNINILKDYYQALSEYKKVNNLKNNSKLLSEIIEDESKKKLLSILYPSMNVFSIDISSVQEQLLSLQNMITEDNQQLTIDFLVSLENKLEFIENLDFKKVKNWIEGSKRVKSKLNKLNENILKKQAQKARFIDYCPNTEAESINKFIANFNSVSWFRKLTNEKYKNIKNELLSNIEQWDKWSEKKQVKALKDTLKSKQIEQQIEDLKNEKEGILSKYDLHADYAIFQYIEDKLWAEKENWKFIYENIISQRRNKFQQWEAIIKLCSSLLSSKILLENTGLDKIYNIDFSTKISSKEWESLCQEYNLSQNEWKDIIQSTDSDSISTNDLNQRKLMAKYPILKNYSFREIAEKAQFIKKNYAPFISRQRVIWEENYLSNKRETINNLLSSKRDNTPTRQATQKSINWINRKWSQKKKKLTIRQYIDKLNFDFLLEIQPLSIMTLENLSKSIPLESELYDTIIIDECSQIEMSHAIPAMIRAKKVIVVGDRKQLQPSKYFKKNITDEFRYDNLMELAEERLESYSLSHHYRSKYRNLIKFSNENFYNNSLITTRKIGQNSISHHYITNATYHQRCNEKEAEFIAKYIVENAIELKNKSLGIVAFSIQQSNLIQKKVEELAFKNTDVRMLINKTQDTDQYFFIKNIESVQGDERDVILISTGYGYNKEGKFYQFFGPILQSNGENRLNVLMSRAKDKIVFVTSIKSSDIRVSDKSSNGLKMFKKLIQWSENVKSDTKPKTYIFDNYWDYFLSPFRN